MSKFRLFFALLCTAALLPAAALAQERGTVTGTVIDAATQQPLGGVQMLIVGTQIGTLTNQQGRYLIPNVPAGRREVRATLIGYGQGSQTVTVAAGETATANFTLAQTAVAIEGMIVTATGREQRQREIGNAVGNINVAEIDLAPITNMTELLQGRAAGVAVLQSSGTTGGGARIRIRGSNSVSLSNEPLIIIDGVRVENNPHSGTLFTGGQQPSRINDINPDDIESIEILKGPAAAAMYGTAGANGVIQITTRRGRAGDARWNVYTEYGQLRDVTQWPNNVMHLDARGNPCPLWFQAEGWCQPVEQHSRNPLMDPETTPFITGDRQKYGIGLSGGTEAVTYFFSGDYEHEQGVYEINWLERFNFRANVTARPRDNLDIALRTGYTSSDLQLPTNDNAWLGVILNATLGHPAPGMSNNGYYFWTPEESFQVRLRQDLRRFTGGMNVNYRPFEWLSVVGTTGLDLMSRHDHDILQPGVIFGLGPTYSDGFRTSNRIEGTNYTNTIDATATFPIRENLTTQTSVGVQHHREEYHDTRGFGEGLTPGTGSLAGTTRLFQARENNEEFATLGLYIQQQFGLNDRLFLTGAVRGDDNSAFGTDVGFVAYPSASLSWVVSEEPFFPQTEILSSLRLRTALGQSGLRPRFRDAIEFYEPLPVRAEGRDIPGVMLRGAGDPRLRPEVVTELEAGFEAGFLRDRLGLEFTYYNKRSRDALVFRRLAPSLGMTTARFAGRFENIGSVENTGFEVLLNAQLVDLQPVRAGFTVSASTNRNTLLQLGEDIEPIIFGRQRHEEGYPLGGYWDFPITGWTATGPGGLLLEGDVQVGEEEAFLGSPFPTREISFIPNITLFDMVNISALVDHKGGHHKLNLQRWDRCWFELICEEIYDPNMITEHDQAAFLAYEEYRSYAGYIEDATFTKLREVSLSFTPPAQWGQRIGLNGTRLTFSGRNLGTWTRYRGLDPEMNRHGQVNFSTDDFYTQPPVRYFTLRLDVNF